MKTYILGDIHGGYKALMQCFERSKFDYKKDRLIVLGDVCDGWTETKEAINELLKVKNLIYILGNHDEWFLNWINLGVKPYIWVSQGGYNTLRSYNFDRTSVPQTHRQLITNAKLFYEEDNILFVHAGIDPQTKADNQPKDILLWDRTLINNARMKHFQKQHYETEFKYAKCYKEVFLGHTTTLWVDKTATPIHVCNIWDLDTGGGWHGKLTIMDLDTKQAWQSDYVADLYPESESRRDYNFDVANNFGA